MSYIRRTPLGLTEEETADLVVGQQSIQKSVDKLIALHKAEERARIVALLIGAGGALFAAVRLGIIVFPKVRARRQARALGELGE